jgi:tetratricopeptide (TPR) repeat protein
VVAVPDGLHLVFLPPYSPAPTRPEQPAPTVAPPQPPDSTPRIFISHSSGDNDFGVTLLQRLRAEGYDVWYDGQGRPNAETGEWTGGLYAGDSWQKQIVKEMSEREVLVILLSPRAVASEWVQDEIAMALGRKNDRDPAKRAVVVPVLRERCEIPKQLADTVQAVDYRPEADQERAWANFLHAVNLPESVAVVTEVLGPPFDLSVLPPLERFVGREADVAWALDRLTGQRDGQLASVAAANGLGGIGKTALATEVARRLRATNAYPDGIAVVICKDQRDPLEVLRAVLARFTKGNAVPQGEDLATLANAARELLDGKRALVILDNVEQEWPVGQVVNALRDAGVSVLLTSRALLPAVPLEASRMLELLPLEEALDVFAEYLGRGGALDLTRAELDAATGIVTALGRHTLAVKLAAAQAATQSRPLEAMAAELTDPDRALHLKNGEEAVRYVLESSVAALPGEAQRLFAALGAFETLDVGREAVLAVARSLGIAGEEDALSGLIALRLVDAKPDETLLAAADRERIRLHPLVQTYARTLLKAHGEEDERSAHSAVAAWYADYTNRTPYLAVAADERNITSALEWAHDTSQDLLVRRLCRGTGEWWRNTGRTSAALRYLPWGVEAGQRIAGETGRQEDQLAAAGVATYHGDTLLAIGRLPAAETIFHEVLQFTREAGDRGGTARSLSRLGKIALVRGRLEEAEGYFQQSLAIRREVQDRQGEGVVLAYLALIAENRERYDEAESYYRAALSLALATEDSSNTASMSSALGELLILHRGKRDEGCQMLKQAAQLYEQMGVPGAEDVRERAQRLGCGV